MNISNSTVCFPQKLYLLLKHEHKTGGVIEWLNDGKVFRINDQITFTQEIIPRYFKHTKLTSFQRQLNLYGFRRMTKGDHHGAIVHPKFQRDRDDLLLEVRRLPAKSSNAANDIQSIDDNELGHSALVESMANSINVDPRHISKHSILDNPSFTSSSGDLTSNFKSENEHIIGYIGQEWHDAMESLDNDLFCQMPTGNVQAQKIRKDDFNGYRSDASTSSDGSAIKGDEEHKRLRMKMIERLSSNEIRSRKKHTSNNTLASENNNVMIKNEAVNEMHQVHGSNSASQSVSLHLNGIKRKHGNEDADDEKVSLASRAECDDAGDKTAGVGNRNHFSLSSRRSNSSSASLSSTASLSSLESSQSLQSLPSAGLTSSASSLSSSSSSLKSLGSNLFSLGISSHYSSNQDQPALFDLSPLIPSGPTNQGIEAAMAKFDDFHNAIIAQDGKFQMQTSTKSSNPSEVKRDQESTMSSLNAWDIFSLQIQEEHTR